MSYWTIEEVADALGMTVAQVYETRRRKEYPGNLGKLRGRRLMFDADLVQAGPQVPESTEDVSEAILWTLQGIEGKLGELLKLAQTQARSRLAQLPPSHWTDEMLEQAVTGNWPRDFYATTTTGDEEE